MTATGGIRGLVLCSLALLLTGGPVLVGAQQGGDSPLSSLPSYRVTEHAPVITGRQDRAFQQALEAAFRKALLSALPDIEGPGRKGADFASWQTDIFSRSREFIASYQVLSQVISEDRLSLTILARVDREKLERTVRNSVALAPLLPVRLLILVDNFPLAGTSLGEDIDAGHAAAGALESAFLRKGAIIVPAPEKLPWQESGGSSSNENRISLSTAAARKSGADYVVLGVLERRADRLLLLSAELVSVSSDQVISATRSPVELQSNLLPQESFTDPAREIAERLSKKLAGRKRPGRDGTPLQPASP